MLSKRVVMSMAAQHAAVVPPALAANAYREKCAAAAAATDADAAAICESAWQRCTALQGFELKPPVKPAKKRRRAWATLLTNAGYASGVKALANSLAENCDSEYPLLIMIGGDGVPEETIAELAKLPGCEIRRVPWLPCPAGCAAYMAPQFTDCWTKLRVWELEDDFEQIVLLDADMVVVRNMDSLLEDLLGDDAAATTPTAAACRVHAVHECFCVVRRGGCAPCAHTAGSADHKCPQEATSSSYFNSGLLVLQPSKALFAHMLVALAATDLSLCPFADQDFLNAYFCGAWTALPWIYNATKGLYASHRADDTSPGGLKAVWDVQQVRNIHYTMAKPWNLRHPCHKGYEQLNEIWWAAFSEPRTLCRMLLKLRMHEKRAKEQQQAGQEVAAGQGAGALQAGALRAGPQATVAEAIGIAAT